jgi:hypothetical protein
MVRSTSMPMSRAAGRLWAMALMARPVREYRMKAPRSAMRSMASPTMAASR